MGDLLLRLHAVLPVSLVNGPGRRSVIWVQGCHLGCPGCFNSGTFDPRGGFERSVGELLDWLPADTDGVTFSGGEPFLQPLALAALARGCRERGLTVMCYSGFSFDWERRRFRQRDSQSIQALLDELDILVEGPFLKDHPPCHPWAGSGNQRVLFLKENRQDFRPLEVSEHGVEQWEEITIGPDGRIVATGF